MNTSHIAKYAPKARTDFIAAMAKQAAKYGITENDVAVVDIKGDVALIDGRAFPAAIVKSRDALIKKVAKVGFSQAMEQAAYSWFNRFCAIRYMELAGYLGHGRRVLSHPEQGNGYQILEDCLDIDLPGLDQQKVRDLKLDGTKDEELYRELLLGQCHALHKAMPFLFEPVDDATELLLPDNLTKTDSLIKELVTAIPEPDWQNIEIIGWLYQFYISEKKDQVIGKVVASADIPAATQLFTPNWIVKYMVQNSLGAQWLATYPDSPLKRQMEYYIEPAEQTDEVNAQLASITPGQLNPEALTLIDPASGSGHILVEAYDLFKAIYLERGYRQRDVPQLILEKNLFGLDIDERAAQLTGFALMMKGRGDDRRLFERGLKLNVMALVDSAGFDAQGLAHHPQIAVELSGHGLKPGDLTELKRLFEYATTFGSLIQVPEGLASSLPALSKLATWQTPRGQTIDWQIDTGLKLLGSLVQQAQMLAAQYDAVVANPPYMGSKYHTPILKKFLKDHYNGYEKDVFSAFIVRFSSLGLANARIGVMSPHVWMYISSHKRLRDFMSSRQMLESLVELPLSGFRGATVQICSFTFRNTPAPTAKGKFIRLLNVKGGDAEMASRTKEAIRDQDSVCIFEAAQNEFKKIPGSPVAYWVSNEFRNCFVDGVSFTTIAEIKQGMATSDNNRFIRLWYEVSRSEVSFDCRSIPESAEKDQKWYPYKKGGEYRKWHGNDEFVVNWYKNGRELKKFQSTLNQGWNVRLKSREFYFRPSINWSFISSSYFGVRQSKGGFIFDVAGSSAFPHSQKLEYFTGFLCSKVAPSLISAMNPTINFQVENIAALPVIEDHLSRYENTVRETVSALIEYEKLDWDAYERSWDFQSFPLLPASTDPTPTLKSSYTAWITQNKATIAEMKRLEEENNRLFIDAYGLQDELTPEVPLSQITLTVNPAYRYGGKLTEQELWTRFRQDTCEELISYAIGCMMGRYSLDAPGLSYAHSGNEGFDALLSEGHYTTFPADDDGIIPLTDRVWFDDDAAHRVEAFIAAAWDKAQLEGNLRFLADNLSPKRGESSRDTLRRYLSDKFYKDHTQTYKKRPIYWLFSSGKQRAFQCLIYLHRYNDSTLARMRTEYVIPLTARLSSHVKKLENDKEATDSTAETKRLEKQINKLHKQQAELSTFDEKLRHYADQQISLDLDDGVKVNYAKFGDLLADVKAITGKNP